MSLQVLCDGCWQPGDISTFKIFVAVGMQVRYCPDCSQVWASFKVACDAEGKRRQRELDLWEEERRKVLPLLVTPLDFPRVAVDAQGNAMVLR